MSAEEMVENLGTIAHSGARQFMHAVRESGRNASDLIGQFGVGFYPVFMVAEWVRVTSRSFRPRAKATSWYATDEENFQVGAVEKAERGTTLEIKLKEEAAEFAEEGRLKEIIRRHSDYIAFPIYVGDDEEPANKRTAMAEPRPDPVSPGQARDRRLRGLRRRRVRDRGEAPRAGAPALCPKCGEVLLAGRTGEVSDTIDRAYVLELHTVLPKGHAQARLRKGRI